MRPEVRASIPLSSIHLGYLMFCVCKQIFDDMDLEFGLMRLLPKGGHGGHNG